MRRKLVALILLALLLVGGAVSYVGYGNPWREIEFPPKVGDRHDFSAAFFVINCKADGRCEFHPKHRKVRHFWQGDGVRGDPGNIQGSGWNPISVLRNAGLEFLPPPDYIVAALRWCTNSEIHQEPAWHGRHYIIPRTGDDLAAARCVKRSIPGRFSVSVADPIGRNEERQQFAILELQ